MEGEAKQPLLRASGADEPAEIEEGRGLDLPVADYPDSTAILNHKQAVAPVTSMGDKEWLAEATQHLGQHDIGRSCEASCSADFRRQVPAQQQHQADSCTDSGEFPSEPEIPRHPGTYLLDRLKWPEEWGRVHKTKRSVKLPAKPDCTVLLAKTWLMGALSPPITVS